MCHELQFVLPSNSVSRRGRVPPWRLSKCKTEKLTEGKKESMDPIQIQCEFQDFRRRYPGYILFFTGGSKVTDGVGCAFTHGDRHERFKLPGYCSIFTAEATAILQTLQYIGRNAVEKCVVCTDSMSVVSALKDTTSEHPVITDIILLYHNLAENGHDITILWIPGHCNITGNEAADAQAKAAVYCDRTLDIPAGYKEHIPGLRSAVNDAFNQLWAKYRSDTNLKRIKEVTGKWDSSIRTNRREEIVLCRLGLGHTRFTHSYILDREPRPQCNTCGCPRSVEHMLIECPEFANQRIPVVNICHRYRVTVALKNVLGNEYPDIIDEVFNYLRECQLLTRALMRSGELRVLMRGWPKGPPLRIFKSKSRRVKIQTALERSRRTLQDTIMLTLFFDLCVRGRSKMVKKGQNVLIYGSQLFVT